MHPVTQQYLELHSSFGLVLDSNKQTVTLAHFTHNCTCKWLSNILAMWNSSSSFVWSLILNPCIFVFTAKFDSQSWKVCKKPGANHYPILCVITTCRKMFSAWIFYILEGGKLITIVLYHHTGLVAGCVSMSEMRDNDTTVCK